MPLLQSGSYEKVLPMDIYPVYLIKSIMAEDIEEMEGLGILECDERFGIMLVYLSLKDRLWKYFATGA